jgi:fibronectin-binding autotransporter adhesin
MCAGVEVRAGVGVVVAGIRYTRKARLLAGASCATLAIACGLPAPATAGTYLVSNETELRAAVVLANADGDASATIVLANNISMAGTTSTVPPTKPITINTQSFTLSGPSGGNALFFQSGSGSFTLVGSFVGGDAVAGAGRGVLLNSGASATNMGIIQGGNSQTAGGGPGVELGTTAGANTFVNNGTIRGGTGPTHGTGGAGAGIWIRNATTTPVVNTGTIEGGAGAPAIVLNQATAAYSLINSGTIRAGAGQADAIRWSSFVVPTTGALTLELQAGSVIEGNVVANAASVNNILRLGGTTNSTFDVSAIGAAAQYRNFDIFEYRHLDADRYLKQQQPD